MTDTNQSRRRFLRVAGVAASGLAIAGCSAAPGDTTTTAGGGGGETTTAPETTESSDSGGSGAWKQTSTVDMTAKLKYAPKKIQVSKGTTVTWKNTSSIGHTVTAYEDKIPDGATYFASGGFKSEQAARDGYKNGQKGNIPKGETYEHTFETKGEYKYFCIPHELNGMVGYVKVV